MLLISSSGSARNRTMISQIAAPFTDSAYLKPTNSSVVL